MAILVLPNMPHEVPEIQKTSEMNWAASPASFLRTAG